MYADLSGRNLRPSPHVSGYFWYFGKQPEIFSFSPFSKNTHPHLAVSESFSPVHTKTLKQHPLLSMLQAESIRCVASSYVSVHTQMESRRFKKSPLWRAFWKDAFHPIRVDGRPNRRKKFRFQTKNGYVWTGRSGRGGARRGGALDVWFSQ